MPLSTLAVKNAKKKDKAYKLADMEGLYLLVQTNGSRLWRFDYRHEGKRKTAAFGAFPAVSLVQAREERDAAKKLLKRGVDPSLARQVERQRARGGGGRLFEEVGREWLAKEKPSWSADYADVMERRLNRYLFPKLGRMPIDEIDAPLVLGVMRQIEATGAAELPRRVLRATRKIFSLAKATGRVKHNPADGLVDALKAQPKVKHRAKIRGAELPAFLADLDDYDGEERTRLGLNFIILTMVRTSEARFSRWTEFEGREGKEPLWRIPPDRMKMGREHLVPLAPQAVALLDRLEELAHGSPYVFPGAGRDLVTSENTFLFAVYRMGYHTKATVHGFRGTASTVLNEQGFNSDWIEMQLAHAEEDGVRGASNSAEYLPGRRKMLGGSSRSMSDGRRARRLI
jgi:integrase